MNNLVRFIARLRGDGFTACRLCGYTVVHGFNCPEETR